MLEEIKILFMIRDDNTQFVNMIASGDDMKWMIIDNSWNVALEST